MNRKNILANISIILFIILFIVGCTPNNESSNNVVSLDFLITPEQLKMHSDSQLEELKEVESKVIANTELMKKKYDDISKMSEEDLKIQEGILKQFMDVLNSGKVIENKNTIENIFNQLKELEGIYVDSFGEEVVVKIELIENLETESVVSLDNAYLREFMLLEDGNMVIPKGIMKESTTGLEPTGKIEYIKVTLTDKLKSELEELVQD